MSKVRTAFGQKIRAIRKSQKISQEVLADKCGLHYTYIGAVERGECNLSFDNIEKISKALGVTMGELMTVPDSELDTSDEAALRAEILTTFAGKPAEEIHLGLRVLRDTLAWLRNEPSTRRRRRRPKV